SARLSLLLLKRTTNLLDFNAKAISEAVPAPPTPQATMTSLVRTLILFRALPMSVMMATSTAPDIVRLSFVGRIPTVSPPEAFAPLFTASITPSGQNDPTFIGNG